MYPPTTSVQSHLEVGRVEWPASLVPPDVHARLVESAHKLPDPVMGVFIECHLTEASRTDYGVRMSRADAAAALGVGRCPGHFREFFGLWAGDGHPAARLQTIDIELDMADASALPFISPSLEPDLLDGLPAIEQRRRQEVAAGRKRFSLDVGIPVLRALDPTLPDGLLATVERFADALPTYGTLIPVWCGSFRPGAHPEPAIRATIALPRILLRSYLRALDWTGDIRGLERVVDLVRPSSPWIGFDADIFEGRLGHRLGVYQEHVWARANDPDLDSTLERLEKKGLCLPSRLGGLRSWLAERPAQAEPGQARSLSLKLVVNGDRPLVVKAYISTFDEAAAMRGLARSLPRDSRAALT